MTYCKLCEDFSFSEQSEEFRNNWFDEEAGPYCDRCFDLLCSPHLVVEMEERCTWTTAKGTVRKTEWKLTTNPCRCFRLIDEAIYFYSDPEGLQLNYWTSLEDARLKTISNHEGTKS